MKTIQESAFLIAKAFRIIVSPALTLMLIVMAICSCTVGPNYQRPETKTIPAAYTGVPDAWKVAAPQAHLPKGNWWEIFGDPFLSRLESDAAEANQDLKAAYARVKQHPHAAALDVYAVAVAARL